MGLHEAQCPYTPVEFGRPSLTELTSLGVRACKAYGLLLLQDGSSSSAGGSGGGSGGTDQKVCH